MNEYRLKITAYDETGKKLIDCDGSKIIVFKAPNMVYTKEYADQKIYKIPKNFIISDATIDRYYKINNTWRKVYDYECLSNDFIRTRKIKLGIEDHSQVTYHFEVSVSASTTYRLNLQLNSLDEIKNMKLDILMVYESNLESDNVYRLVYMLVNGERVKEYYHYSQLSSSDILNGLFNGNSVLYIYEYIMYRFVNQGYLNINIHDLKFISKRV